MTEADVCLKHKVAIDLVDEFGSRLDSILNELAIDRSDGQQVMVVGLCERLRSSAQGCVALARLGLSAEVKILARSCIEAIFKIQGLCMNVGLVRSYAHEHLFFQRKALRAVIGDLRSSFSQQELAEAQERLAKVDKEIASFDAKEMKIWNWSSEAKLTAMYRSLYALYSNFVHAASTSLNDWLPTDSEDNLVQIVSGPTDFDLTETLLAVATCLQYCLQDICVLMDLEFDAALMELVTRRHQGYGFDAQAQ